MYCILDLRALTLSGPTGTSQVIDLPKIICLEMMIALQQSNTIMDNFGTGLHTSSGARLHKPFPLNVPPMPNFYTPKSFSNVGRRVWKIGTGSETAYKIDPRTNVRIGLAVGLVELSIANVFSQLWRKIKNKKRALNKMPCDNKENSHFWRQIRTCWRSIKWILIITTLTVFAPYSFVINWL